MIDAHKAQGKFLRCTIAATVFMLSACSKAASPDMDNKPAIASTQGFESKEISLAIEGYNYTSRYIDSFSVDGAGGGNVRVSSPTSGGGGTACCVSYQPGMQHHTVMVRWQSDACAYRVRSPTSGEVFNRVYAFFKDKEVAVDESALTDAKYMEIHFYPDGQIKAKITSTASLPLLSLSKDREDRSDYPRCPGDKKPVQ